MRIPCTRKLASTSPVSATVILVFCMLASGAMGADKKRQLTAENVLNLKWALLPEVSPDGQTVLYRVLETKDGQRQTTVWMAATTKGARSRQVLSEFTVVSHVRWSPDGKTLTFLATDKNAKRGRQLFVSKADATMARCLTNMPNGIGAYCWSTDSTMIAFTADERSRKATDIVVVGSDSPRAALWAVGLDDTKPKRLTSDHQHIIDFDWSPDGEELAVLVAKSESSEVASPPTSLEILRRRDGKTLRVLAENATGDCRIAWSPNGKTIAAPILAPKKISRRLALFPAAGGKPIFPFANYHATPMSRVEWTADSRHLFVQFTEKTRNQLVRLELVTGKMEHVSDEFTNFWDYGIDKDGTTIAFNAESQHDPPDIFVKRKGTLHRLTDFNPHLTKLRLGEVKTVEWKSSLDGRTVYGVLITPPDYEVGKPCPTVVNLHSGPHWMWWEGWVGTYLSWGQYLASNGYAVFMPNHRGSIGQGWEFAEAHYLEWGRGDYQDVMDGVDWLIKEGVTDPNRLGIGGASFGGYLTALTITQTNRFKAAVVDAGWVDLVTSNLTIDAPQGMRIYLNGDELNRAELYRSRSPLTFVDRCQTPTLIMHGADDRRVPTDQGRMFYRALKLNNCKTQMVIYQNEGHGLANPINQLDAIRRIKVWFDSLLLGKP